MLLLAVLGIAVFPVHPFFGPGSFFAGGCGAQLLQLLLLAGGVLVQTAGPAGLLFLGGLLQLAGLFRGLFLRGLGTASGGSGAGGLCSRALGAFRRGGPLFRRLLGLRLFGLLGLLGFGLGLSVVKKLCIRQNWELSVESEEGKGSTFRIRFFQTDASEKKLPENSDETPSKV